MKNLSILIKPASSLCNMRCDYCFYLDESRICTASTPKIMELSTLSALTKKAFDIAEESVSFIFQGGEPTLAGLDFFKTALQYQKKYNLKSVAVYNTIQTNGVLIDKDWADFFAKNRFLVGLSLDGTEKLHNSHRRLLNGDGSYSAVISAAEQLKSAGADFNILAVVSRDSAKESRKVYESLKKYKYLQFIPLIDSFSEEREDYSLNADDYAKFLIEAFDEYYKDFMNQSFVSVRDFDGYVSMLLGLAPSSCAMSGRCGGYFTVEADGSVYPCDFYVTDEHKIGSIISETFKDLMEKHIAKDFILDSTSVSEKCKGCAWYKLCRGGCKRYKDPRTSISKFCSAYEKFFIESYEKIREIATIILNKSKTRRG